MTSCILAPSLHLVPHRTSSGFSPAGHISLFRNSKPALTAPAPRQIPRQTRPQEQPSTSCISQHLPLAEAALDPTSEYKWHRLIISQQKPLFHLQGKERIIFIAVICITIDRSPAPGDTQQDVKSLAYNPI